MNITRRIAKNTALLLIASLISYGIGFFITIYTARYLGDAGFGIISIGLSLTGIFGVINDLGLGTLMIREISKEESLTDKYLINNSVMKIILAVITFLMIALTANIIGYDQVTIIAIYLITISLLIGGFSGILNSIFQAREKMEFIALGVIINSVTMLLGTFIGIFYKFDVLYFAALYSIANGMVFIYILIMYFWKFPLPKSNIDLSFWKSTIKEAWPFGVTGLFVTIYYYIDSIILSIMVSIVAVGWYNAAYKMIVVLLFIPTVLNSVIFPVMSKLYKTSSDSLRLTYEKYFQYMVIIGIPIGVGTTLLADKLILLLYGPQFTNSIIALQILVWSSVIIFISGSFARLLEVSNKQLVLTKITAICAVINIILNILLIPYFGIIAASAITVLTEFIALLLGLKVVSSMNYGLSKKELSYFLKTCFACIIMGIFIVYFHDMNLFILILIATIIYFIVLYLIRIFDNDDIKIIKNIINR